MQGVGTEVNVEKAVECFRRAAAQGYARAQANLAKLHDAKANEVKQDQKKLQCHASLFHHDGKLEPIAKKVDDWMRRTDRSNQTHNQSLLIWIAKEGGADVRNYKDFCELARILSDKGYWYLTEPPSEEKLYQKALAEFDKQQKLNNGCCTIL